MTVDQEGGYSLAHPVYLDVPMMISFLAHLEGGVSVQEEETRKEIGARDRALRSRVGLRLRLPTFLETDAGAEHATQRRDETSLESKTERHHTNASLFNLLYEYLRSDDQVVDLRAPDELHALRGGQLVELAGEYLGNPLEDTLAYLGSLLPYVDEQQEAQRAAAEEARTSARRSERSGNSSRRGQSPADVTAVLENLVQQSANADQEFGKKMIVRMVDDIRNVPVHDVLLQAGGGLRAVLTVSSEFYSATTNEYLKAGEFRVVGKVTRVLTGERTINLARRTVLGVAGTEVTTKLMTQMQQAFPAGGVTDPVVGAPAVQILPMAIFL